MKKILSVILVVVLSLGLFVGCKTKNQPATTSATPKESKKVNTTVVKPLPETVDLNNLDNCTVAVSLEKGDAYVDDSGKMVMDVTVYSYEVYDMVDIAALKENDVIVRQNKEVTIS